ncbi:MAG TPA: DUF6306 domain-containing protein [Ktedonobacterales bacterium]|nr:DUF6306 domain-containing protein [Ktedonobacterales bacterium]
MATLDGEAVTALNTLLEDERASVEIALALATGATELYEREAFDLMGAETVLACCALRERLTESGAEVTRRINGIVFPILGTDRYDDRLRAFAHHQASICEAVAPLLDQIEDEEAHRTLEDVYEAGTRTAQWCEQRAEEFAQSRLIDFRTGTAGVSPDQIAGPPEAQAALEEAGGVPQHRPDRKAEESEYLGEQGETPDIM